MLGVGLSQLMTFFTASLFKTQIANFRFFFSVHAFNLTLACMLVMFVLTLLLNLRAVRRTKLIELMGAERRNESIKTRNPGSRLPSLLWAWCLWAWPITVCYVMGSR